VTLNNLAITCKRAGELSRAATLAAEAMVILEETRPADHPRLAVCRANEELLSAATRRALSRP
jgi:hypothetical protein